MQTGEQMFFDNYTPAADITVIAVCFVIFILVMTSYMKKNTSFYIFINIVGFLLLAAFCDLFYHFRYTRITDGSYTSIYVLRCFYHAFLFSNMLLFVVYIVNLLHLEKFRKVPILVISGIIYIVVISVDIVTTVSGKGFRLNKDGSHVSGLNIFLFGYLAFMIVVVTVLIRFRDRLYKRIMYALYGTIAVSVLIHVMQGIHSQSSYTVASFMFPVIAILYLLHSNPYNAELGAIDIKTLEDTINYNYKKKNELLIMSLYLPDCDAEGKGFPKKMQDVIRHFAEVFFKGAVLFQVSNGHVILVAKKKLNPDHENRENKIINAFYPEYEKFQMDYKIVMGESIDEISRKNEYVSFIRNIHRKMPMNTMHMVTYDDVTEFNRYEFILNEVADIAKKQDPDDPRVLAYCQPVYHIKRGAYNTAEALMRLELPKIGMVFPDQFIPLAEENGYIHELTKIILHKTCMAIKSLIGENLWVKRISVNVSVLELRENSFADDICGIIEKSGIPVEKIAIEITESQTESDFMIMKDTIENLKEKGIKFYLDDFGTGYSNMERIMELPFDIIKFDRSLVIASSQDERSGKMVAGLAGMFKELGYSVLYEGVENENDEKRCTEMSASYLQGYKYSRPIPIGELRRFFSPYQKELAASEEEISDDNNHKL